MDNTFKVQWNYEIVEQDFDYIMLDCEDGKIEITAFHRDEDDDFEPESLGFYSSPEFACDYEKAYKINHYFKTKDYPLRIAYHIMSPSVISIEGFGDLFESDEILPLNTIIDDVLEILLLEDEEDENDE